MMQYYYGDKSIHRALDEAEFWKNQESEHTVVIQEIVPDLEEKYLTALQEFGISFSDMQARAVGYIRTIIRSNGNYESYMRDMTEFIKNCLQQSQSFIRLLGAILRNSEAVKRNSTAQTVIKHIIRESQYFVGIDRLILRT